jgi:FMN phosphatase YigB (HAD superfamily)
VAWTDEVLAAPARTGGAPGAEGRDLAELRGIFFDLDGTLLQVDMERFIPAYIDGLAGVCADLAERRRFSEVLLKATWALLHSDRGECSNQQLFNTAIERHLTIAPGLFAQRLERYCAEQLPALETLITPHPLVPRILQGCFERGLKVVVATNPVFPRPLVEARLGWGAMGAFPFDLVTSYENCRYCKPHPGFFEDILQTLELAPQHCLMVGNDTVHDLSARQAGIATFLLDTWLVDRGGGFRPDFRGGHAELCRLVETLPRRCRSN